MTGTATTYTIFAGCTVHVWHAKFLLGKQLECALLEYYLCGVTKNLNIISTGISTMQDQHLTVCSIVTFESTYIKRHK